MKHSLGERETDRGGGWEGGGGKEEDFFESAFIKASGNSAVAAAATQTPRGGLGYCDVRLLQWNHHRHEKKMPSS